MHYALIVYETEADMALRGNPETAPAYMGAYQAYHEALLKAGVAAGGEALHTPALATTVRLREGRRLVQDGPFSETKEQLGGLFVIDVPDLDTALEWAARCPAASTGSVEVRPVMPSPSRDIPVPP
ncbi:MAG: YciI family protein [Opitutaceae bacterium]